MVPPPRSHVVLISKRLISGSEKSREDLKLLSTSGRQQHHDGAKFVPIVICYVRCEFLSKGQGKEEFAGLPFCSEPCRCSLQGWQNRRLIRIWLLRRLGADA